MNDASRKRIQWARALAVVYASEPDVRVILLGGSTARQTAHDNSDIDLGLFWVDSPSRKKRQKLLRRVGGQLDRSVDNRLRYSESNPRQRGCLEIITYQPDSQTPPVVVDLEHETIAGTDEVLSDVVDRFDPSLEKQELLSVIQSGVVLHGHDVVVGWREKAANYPHEVAEKMIARHLAGVGQKLLDQAQWAGNQDWFLLYEGFLDIGRRLSLALMGLNKVWVFTDNPDFKGLKSFAEEYEHQPERFVERLGLFLQSKAPAAIRGFAGLSLEILDLVEVQVPDAIDTAGERRRLEKARSRAVG